MELHKGRKELLFFIENYTGRNDYIKEMTKPCKHAQTYINRFTICEEDQFDISKIVVLNSNWGTKAGRRPTKIQKMIESMKTLSTANVDIFLFGWYEFRGALGGTTRRIDIKDTLTKARFQNDTSNSLNGWRTTLGGHHLKPIAPSSS